MTVTLTARNADIETAKAILVSQRDARWDRVVPANQLRYEGGRLIIAGHGPERLEGDTPDEARFVPGDLALDPSEGFESQLCDVLKIPRPFFRRHRDGHIGQLDQMVSYWLGTRTNNVLVRGFTDGDGGGIARAFLSDGYGPLEHLDYLVAIVQAVAATGVPYEFRAINLTEDNFRLDVVSPAVTALAPALLEGYVSPFTGQRGADLPVLRAGVRFENSEVGRGKLKETPFAEVLVCTNGMTMTRFAEDMAITRIHRGRRLPAGAISWSDATRKAQLEALRAEMTDATRAFFDPTWFQAKVAEIEAEAVRPVEAGNVVEIIAKVSETLSFSDEERDGILAAFIEGQQLTNGAVVQAITAHAQRVTDPTRAALLEDKALDALALV